MILKTWLLQLNNWLRGSAEACEVEAAMSWSISSRLAAIPDAALMCVPFDVAFLITEAKQLHPVMAQKSKIRSVERERNGLGFMPRFHFRIEYGPCQGCYALHPMMCRLASAMKKSIDEEAAHLIRAGAEILNPFDQSTNYTGVSTQ
jgi:hypothetical protein